MKINQIFICIFLLLFLIGCSQENQTEPPKGINENSGNYSDGTDNSISPEKRNFSESSGEIFNDEVSSNNDVASQNSDELDNSMTTSIVELNYDSIMDFLTKNSEEFKKLLRLTKDEFSLEYPEKIRGGFHVYRLRSYSFIADSSIDNWEICFDVNKNKPDAMCIRLDKRYMDILGEYEESICETQKLLKVDMIYSLAATAPSMIVRMYTFMFEQDGLLYVFGGVGDEDADDVDVNEILVLLADGDYRELIDEWCAHDVYPWS